ncbi:hypothetical protein AB0N89_12265 [Amycolatopsis sp. NPDC089917]|uniref:hypothetical protein n=1 Tax=Amycolatopsis sp. NPDC089917 TaxID=3155187 RepID=UPI0034465669
MAGGDHVPGTFAAKETSATFAGIGGAGTIHTGSVTDHHGNHWAENSAALAGPMGAVVLHSKEVESGTHHGWPVDDKPGRPTYNHGKQPIAQTDGDREYTSKNRPSRVQPVSKHRPSQVQPARESGPSHVAYTESTKSADMTGATSSHVASHAGDHHAAYESSDLSAGPDGAVSEGVKAVAVPQYSAYHKWYTAAGENGAISHDVSAVAGATGWSGSHRG